MSYIHRDCEVLLMQERKKIREHEKRHDQNRAVYEKERIELYLKIQNLENTSLSVENCLSLEKRIADLEKALAEKQTSFNTERSSLMIQLDNHERQFDDQQQRFITYSTIQQIEFETEKSCLLDKITVLEKRNADLSQSLVAHSIEKQMLTEKQKATDEVICVLNDKLKRLEKQISQDLILKCHKSTERKEVMQSQITGLKDESSQSSSIETFHSTSSRAFTDVLQFSDFQDKQTQKVCFAKDRPTTKQSPEKSFHSQKQKQKPEIDMTSATQVYNLNDFVSPFSQWNSKRRSDSQSFDGTHHFARTRNFHKKQSFRQNSSTQVYDLNHFVSHGQSLSTTSCKRNGVSNPKTTNVKGPKMKWVPRKIILVLQKETVLSNPLDPNFKCLNSQQGTDKHLDNLVCGPKVHLRPDMQTQGC